MSGLSDTPREDQMRQLRDAAVEAVVVRGWAVAPGTWLDDNGRWCGRDGVNSVCPVSTSWAHELITSWELAYSTAMMRRHRAGPPCPPARRAQPPVPAVAQPAAARFVVRCLLTGHRHEQLTTSAVTAAHVTALFAHERHAHQAHWQLRDDLPQPPTLMFTQNHPADDVHATVLRPGIPADEHPEALCGTRLQWQAGLHVCSPLVGDACPSCVLASHDIPGWVAPTPAWAAGHERNLDLRQGPSARGPGCGDASPRTGDT